MSIQHALLAALLLLTFAEFSTCSTAAATPESSVASSYGPQQPGDYHAPLVRPAIVKTAGVASGGFYAAGGEIAGFALLLAPFGLLYLEIRTAQSGRRTYPRQTPA